MKFFVDMQGFNDSSGQFIVKELGIVSEEENSRPLHYLFEAPYEFETISSKMRACNSWLTRNLHHLPWHVGDVPYSRLNATLEVLKDSVTFVKGCEKKQLLEERVKCEVFDLNECDGCPSLSKLRSSNASILSCPVNHDSSYCAYKTCQILKEWYFCQTCNIDDCKWNNSVKHKQLIK